jgi:hypothetical protein
MRIVLIGVVYAIKARRFLELVQLLDRCPLDGLEIQYFLPPVLLICA